MSIELTPEQAKALSAEAFPVRVVGPEETYVLIRAELYERLRPLLEDAELSDADEAALLREAGLDAGWDDPGMDIYDDLVPPKS